MKKMIMFAAVAGLVLALAPVAPAQAGGLVALWKFDGDATDSAGSFDAVEVNTPGYAAGKIGQAISLNGTNQYADAPDIGTHSQVSVSVWVNCSDIDIRGEISVFADNNSWQANPGTPHLFLAGAVGDVYVDLGQDVCTLITSTSPIIEGQWHHIAWTYDKTATNPGELYIDGAPAVTSNTNNVGDLRLDDMYIGNGFNRYFPGMIDDLAVWDEVLSPGAVATIRNNGLLGIGVPEPATMALLAFGGLGVLLRRRRR